MRLPNLYTAPMGNLIKIRTFLKKRGFFMAKLRVCATFQRSYTGPNFLKFGADIQNRTKCPTINLK